MHRFLLCLLIALPLPSQTQDVPNAAPKEVDDALRARVKQFYDYHMERKFRLAEQLVAEDAKDDFYAVGKPDLRSFHIGSIEYSDNFTKAKVIMVGAMPVPFPMAATRVMDQPFASYWKMENGIWCWYFNRTASRMTPFGELKEPPKDYKPGTPSALAVPNAEEAAKMIARLQSALKIDRTRIDLAPGKPQSVKVTNTLPGQASLTVDCPDRPIAKTGITATLDKKDLKGNDTATLTFSVADSTPAGLVPIMITVMPTNQVLTLTINVMQ